MVFDPEILHRLAESRDLEAENQWLRDAIMALVVERDGLRDGLRADLAEARHEINVLRTHLDPDEPSLTDLVLDLRRHVKQQETELTEARRLMAELDRVAVDYRYAVHGYLFPPNVGVHAGDWLFAAHEKVRAYLCRAGEIGAANG